MITLRGRKEASTRISLVLSKSLITPSVKINKIWYSYKSPLLILEITSFINGVNLVGPEKINFSFSMHSRYILIISSTPFISGFSSKFKLKQCEIFFYF